MKKIFQPIASGKKPVLGHFLAFRKNPFAFFQKHTTEQKDLFWFDLLGRKILVLNHPEAVKHVLINKAKIYSRKPTYHFLVELLGEGLLTTEGDIWKQKRRLAQPFFTKEQMDGLFGIMEHSAKTFWDEFQPHQTFNLEEEMNHLALVMLTDSILQAEMDFHFHDIKEHLHIALEYLTKNRFNAFKWQKKLPSKIKTKGRKSISELKKIVGQIIEHRKESTHEHHDLLAMYMSTSDAETGKTLQADEILDEVMTMFVAGHDTTSVVLTWTLVLLHQYPESLQKVRQEIDENYHGQPLNNEELKKFTYLKMCINESMRLYPPVWSYGRKSMEDDEIMGIPVPQGHNVNIPVLFLHRNPQYWERPTEFYPEHFEEEAVKQRDKLAYIPFSAGQHRCIGEYFALVEVQMALIHLIKNYDFRITLPPKIELDLLVTIKPKYPISFELTPKTTA